MSNLFPDKPAQKNGHSFTTVPELVSQIEKFTASSRAGKVRTGILLWALGVPIPLVLLFLLVRGCMGG